MLFKSGGIIMWSFLVLGIIPGTDIQINFSVWLVIVDSLLLLAYLLRLAINKLRNTQLPPTISSEPGH